MKPRRRRLSLVGMLVVGLLPVVWFLTDWGVFTICLPVLSMSKHLRPQIHLASLAITNSAVFIVYGQQIQDKLVFCCFKTMKSTYDIRGKSLKYVKLRI